MTLTKRHFEKLATSLHQAKPAEDGASVFMYNAAIIQWKRDVQSVSSVCQESNSLFDADRFKQWAEEGPA